MRARMVDTRTGEIVPVVDAAGQTSPFQPTTGDVEHHHAELQLRAFAVHTRASAGRTLRDVAVVAIGALVLGAGTPVRRAATG